MVEYGYDLPSWMSELNDQVARVAEIESRLKEMEKGGKNEGGILGVRRELNAERKRMEMMRLKYSSEI